MGTMDDIPDVETLVAGLVADNESARKYAVFKLQGLLSDPSFADAFIRADGLLPLRQAVLDTNGNTQAYALGSLDALLELDMAWQCCDAEVLEKALSLAISHPLVNIVRNALTLLVLVVSRPLDSEHLDGPTPAGFRALKPALSSHPEFLESLVQRLGALDHTLCANALQLVNALMRDAIVHGGENEWPKFVKRLQDLGVIGAVGKLMHGDMASDLESPLAAAILEFQSLTKTLLRAWREVAVNVELSEHKRALKTVHLLSKPEPYYPPADASRTKARKHHPEKWRRLGFESESPVWDFEETGFLGIMDLVEYCRRNEDTFQKTLLEQSVTPRRHCCPIARASLSVSMILYEQFEIDDTAGADINFYRTSASQNINKIYKPLLLQWGRLHTAALNTFLRLWKDSGAETDDFHKIEEVVRIIVERIIGSAARKTEVSTVEEQLRSISLAEARRWQLENLNEVYQDAWGPHLVQIREQLRHESVQFMREQRIRCLLQGEWFPAGGSWRFVRLSHNRRWLHYQTFPSKGKTPPPLSALTEQIDMDTVTSVDSDISTTDFPAEVSRESTETLRDPTQAGASTKLTILGKSKARPGEEQSLLGLSPSTSALASEWLDGLLLLMNQTPITGGTMRLVDMMVDWGIRLRMLNLRWEDVDWEALERSVKSGGHTDGGSAHDDDDDDDDADDTFSRPVPSRDGVDEEYWYAMPDEA